MQSLSGGASGASARYAEQPARRRPPRNRMLPWILLTLVATALLLVAEARGSVAGRWVWKPLASTGFIAAALAAGAWQTTYGRLVLLALVLSWWGDVLLIPRTRAAFTAGLASFLAGHVAFA